MDKKLLGLIALFFVSFTVFSSIIIFGSTITKFTRAREDTNPDMKNSIVVTYPITVKADGTSQATVTVFLRNKFNKLLDNKQVSLNTTFGEVSEGSVATKDGKATFHISSRAPGAAEITASVDGGTTLEQKVLVNFN